MTVRLLAIVVTLSMFASVAAGTPLHFGAAEGMAMDCCPMKSGSVLGDDDKGEDEDAGAHCPMMKKERAENEDESSARTSHSKDTSISKLCCALNCTAPTPVAPLYSYNFAPTSVSVTDSVARQIAAFLALDGLYSPPPATFDDFVVAVAESPPKYLQHNSFLI